MLVNKRIFYQCFGCLMKNPELLEEYDFKESDFGPEKFHMILFTCINNLYQQGAKFLSPFDIDTYLVEYTQSRNCFESNDGLAYCKEALEEGHLENFPYYYEQLKKISVLRFLEARGVDTKFLYNDTIRKPALQEKEREKFDSMTLEDLIDKAENYLITDTKLEFLSKNGSKGQLAGKNMKEQKEKFKEDPEFGLPLQSKVLTTAARGARLSKLYMRSSSSGGGKTRTAVGDMCNFSIPWFYNTESEEWVHTKISEPVLFISTELDIEEVQTLIIAYVSGVNEEHIIDGKYKEGEEERVDRAIEYIESSPFYIEFIPDFSIQDISSLIKKYKREHGCLYFCFDYVHMSAKLITEVATMSKGMKMREDQILFLFIDTLKNLCNNLNIFILTMSQLNGTYKDSTIKDETMLRGAKNMADRLDLGEISLPPTKGELVAIEPILATQINMPAPNLVRNIYKVRRGKLTHIKIWQYADLGTCRTTDLFITDNDFNFIPIEITEIQPMEIDKIIDEHSSRKDEDIEYDNEVFEQKSEINDEETQENSLAYMVDW